MTETFQPKIVYYVALSLDGFIAGPGGDVSKFAHTGKGVDTYLSDLADFQTVIMGRRTYEFGYQFGLEPGQPAYPHMTHHIFSDSLTLDSAAPSVHVEKMSLERVAQIKENSAMDIYLCGGGQFAGWLLDHGLIDMLKIKLNPIILGGGIPLFGDSKTSLNCTLLDAQTFDEGLQILTYEVLKPSR